jgi:hypothetical protein
MSRKVCSITWQVFRVSRLNNGDGKRGTRIAIFERVGRQRAVGIAGRSSWTGGRHRMAGPAMRPMNEQLRGKAGTLEGVHSSRGTTDPSPRGRPAS